jgi:hypothetical protein
MKKNLWIFISIFIVLIVVIVVISTHYPPIFKGSASGTFGKAEKYRKTQMSEKDIKLRSDLTADTAKLMNTIKSLAYFTLFTQDLSNKIDSCTTLFQNGGMNGPKSVTQLQALKDYSGFIRNNNKVLENTIVILTSFYTGKQADQSADVEKDLRDFSNYVKNMQERDSVLEKALLSMDDFLLNDKVLRTKKQEMESLKSIRDQLLMGGIQLYGILQQKPLCVTLLSQALQSQQSFNALLSSNKLGSLSVNGPVQSNLNSQQLNSLIGSSPINACSSVQFSDNLKSILMSKDGLNSKLDNQHQINSGGLCIVYSKENLQFLAVNQSSLGGLVNSGLQGQSLGVIIIRSNEGLNINTPNLSLMGSGLSGSLNNMLSNSQLSMLGFDKPGLGLINAIDLQAIGSIFK